MRGMPVTAWVVVAGVLKFFALATYGHLEKSLLACRNWPARSVTARDFTPGGEEEAEFFEVPLLQFRPIGSATELLLSPAVHARTIFARWTSE
ncbi:MAG: hypothetical protein ACK6BC_12315 [Cyanobacteriota bacterium]